MNNFFLLQILTLQDESGEKFGWQHFASVGKIFTSLSWWYHQISFQARFWGNAFLDIWFKFLPTTIQPGMFFQNQSQINSLGFSSSYVQLIVQHDGWSTVEFELHTLAGHDWFDISMVFILLPEMVWEYFWIFLGSRYPWSDSTQVLESIPCVSTFFDFLPQLWISRISGISVTQWGVWRQSSFRCILMQAALVGLP